MIRLADQCDVLVVGAGPAGSTAAQLLASWGWSVVLVHRAPSLLTGLSLLVARHALVAEASTS